jgi:hypothetical protein
MDDATVLKRIHGLVDEEHALREQLRKGEISTDDEHARLKQLEESLDQAWDLLRRRRAARDQGQNPDSEKPRAVREVEDYLQ